MTTVYIMASEPFETSFTGQWYKHIPELIEQFASYKNKEISIKNIPGGLTDEFGSSMCFSMDYSKNNIWKNNQTNYIANEFSLGNIENNSIFLFPDFWHPGIIQVRQMAALNDISVKIFAIVHTGAYDIQSSFSKNLNSDWVVNFEKSLADATDILFFATEYHKNLFYNNVMQDLSKLIVSGQPHEAVISVLSEMEQVKENLILFPHKMLPEKQPEIFKDLQTSIPEYDFVLTTESKLLKAEYHELLSKAKLIISCSNQETFGIPTNIEGPISGCLPLVPNRLSYTEVFNCHSGFLYPSEWTSSFEKYLKNKHLFVARIRYMVENYHEYIEYLYDYNSKVIPKYATSNVMLRKIFESIP